MNSFGNNINSIRTRNVTRPENQSDVFVQGIVDAVRRYCADSAAVLIALASGLWAE